MTEEGRGNICIIKNISNGGLCLAIVGSAKQPPRSRIAIKLDRGTFVCHIVKRDDKALHCRFDRPIHKIEDANLLTSWPAAYTEASL